MRVMVSKVVAKILSKNLQNMTVSYEEMSVNAYKLYVDSNALDHYEDFIVAKEKMKVLRVDYPHTYYALPQYATTKDLVRLFTRNNCKTVEEFVQAFQHEYEI